MSRCKKHQPVPEDVRRAADVLERRYAVSILYASHHGCTRFTEFRQALGRIPLFGICLGHQILGRAAGATTSRLPYGHHGANHPVKDLDTGRVHITSQNHEFQVDAASIPAGDFYVSQRNLNDGSVEGLGHRTAPAFSVQYHPEGCPGPQDNQHLYDRFLDMPEH